MTNSETQTEPRTRSRKRARKAPASRDVPAPAAPETGDEALTIRLDKGTARVLARTFFVLLLAGGWLGIVHVNRWHFGPPVLFLWAGWLGVLLTARFLWVAGMSAAYDDDSGIGEEEFWRPVGAQDELLREKRSLLKAIKEIEFDREMGKLSEKDAAELTRFYRARAIELIKTLEGKDQGGELSIEEKIEREVKARLSVAAASAKAKSETARAKGADSKNKTARAKKTAEKPGAEKPGAETTAEKPGAEKAAEKPGAEKAAEKPGAEKAPDEPEADEPEAQKAEKAEKADEPAAAKASEADAGEHIAVAASEDEPRASAEVGS